jgi:cell division GTPase FtsZ
MSAAARTCSWLRRLDPPEIVSELMGDDGLVIWGARIDESYNSTIQVSLVLTGLSSTEQVVEVSELTPTYVDERIENETTEDIDKILEQLGIKSAPTI